MISRGLLTLLVALSSSLFAADSTQVIPFDYFYGKIVGRQVVGVDLRDAENQELTADFSLAGGLKNRFDFKLYGILRWIPGRMRGDHLVWERPPINGRFQVDNGLRYSLLNLDYNEHSNVIGSETGLTRTEANDFSIKQSVTAMSHGEILYSPLRSVRTYLTGVSLGRAEWFAEISNSLSRNNSSLRNFGRGPVEFMETRRSNDSWDNHSYISFDGGIGLSEQVEFRTSGYLSTRDFDDHRLARYDELDSTEMNIERHYFVEDQTQDQFSSKIGASLTVNPKSTLWLSLGATYDHSGIRKTGLESREIVFEEFHRNDRSLSDDSHDSYSTELAATWLSKFQSVDYRKLMDNFSGYYDDELEVGTFLISPTLSLREQDVSLSSSYFHSSDTLYFRSNTQSEEYLALTTKLQLLYQVFPGLSVEALLSNKRSRYWRSSLGSVFSHSQDTQASFRLAYHNYSWIEGSKRAVSWEGVSDLDYLLGPFLEPGDLRLELVVIPPAYSWSAERSTAYLLNYFNGISTEEWEANLSIARGVIESFQPTLFVNYLYSGGSYPGPYYHYFRRTRVDVNVQFEWQLLDRVRIASLLNSTVSFFSEVNYGDSYHSTRNTWSMEIIAHLLI